MDVENYLIEEKSSIIAISRISQIIDAFISKNYCNFGKSKFYTDEIRALNTAIQMITYCMRVRRKECYLEIDCNYEDEFTYNSVILENI
jgi:hypothetical protein